ncbi:hypothetical protein PEX1_010640 [Penicillium expansum]|uniref:Uncharacterized protein n=1 Tax=Penicillium expansum TaxID=27334 RepID=A0A0A2KUV9_PENEN|nr:hypothetical protein PEX2_040810 [Penicillium expansum]KGO45779.1 hypothetical protein PEXP_019020 [Penicillium expansum]KGO57951.1 hypothetical protein PEX2_040810 [Penicillium expansum]KGO70703.1 hypothetical protein PEX1_010640 [Penicillium expansum]
MSAREHKRVYQVGGHWPLILPAFCSRSSDVPRLVSLAGRRRCDVSWDQPIVRISHLVRDAAERAKNVFLPHRG